MAEFCTACAERYGMVADIDTEKLLRKLKQGEEVYFLCEGCEMEALRKDENGEVYRGFYKPAGTHWIKVLTDLV